MIGSHRLIGFFDFSAPFARGCSSYIAIAAARVPAILTARAVNNADYQAFTEKSFADAGKPWQSSAIGDGKLCLTAGKPQSGVACGKSAAINMCLEVAQHCSTSSTPIYCVGFDSPQVSLRYTSG